MGRTITSEPDPEILEQLYTYAREFRLLFPRSDQFKQGRTDLHGLRLEWLLTLIDVVLLQAATLRSPMPFGVCGIALRYERIGG